MAQVSTYLSFEGNCEEAFAFYSSVFGTEFVGEIARMGDAPMPEGAPALGDEAKRLVMNVQLPILAGHLLMGSDVPPGMGIELNRGNNVQICLDPDTRADADARFAALAAGGTVDDPLREVFWGDYYGTLVDRFGVRWIVNCTSRA